MAKKKFTELPAATTPLDGTEIIAIVQGGVSKKTTVDDLPAGGGGTVDSIVAGQNVSVDDTDPANPIVSVSLAMGSITVSTSASSTITLPFSNNIIVAFIGNLPIDEPKLIEITNVTAVHLQLIFFFEISDVAAVLEWETNVKMADVRWNSVSKEWTPDGEGLYKAVGHYNVEDDEWLIDIGSVYE
jgi:hypothetical protein